MAQHYQIKHLALSVDDPQRLIASLSERMLGMFRRPMGPHELAPGRLRLEVHAEPHRAVHREAIPHVWHGFAEEVELAISRRGARRRIELPGRAVLDFDIDAGWAQLAVPGTANDAAKWFLLLRLVCDSLTRGGHSFVHAACLAVPRHGEWQGVVLSAPSNTGKTTTALALANSGWRLLGDDVTYVRPPHQGSSVWGFPRACHVRPGSYAMLPWLEELECSPPGAEGVRKLTLEKLEHRGWVDGPWLRPALVVILEKPNRRTTRVEPIDRVDALSCLGGESINAAPEPCNEDAARDFVTMGRLVCAAPACRLSVGPDVTDVAAKLGQFMAAHGATGVRRSSFGVRRAA